ncbi:ECF transporter S component [Clostridium niameyense]|uniref:ECF transporter S component n=1 Tax=Clostridium niameyense TaxID=1622073 RepID=A0A6M0R937_9CLOT|nr:ECF transporter S component [Clostridium niameyense]NEZ46775.1 ECF transporter S component [Clostridium niameyense]
MEQKNAIYSTNILDIVQVAVMAAIVCVTTFTIKVPTYTGYTHIGDSMVLLSVMLLGTKKAVIASSIGMGLTDIISGYVAWAPFTIVIKGVMALIAGKIIYSNKNEDKLSVNLIAFIIAGLWMVTSYYFSGAIMTRFILFKSATLQQSLILALKEIPSNLVQAILGIIIALPLGKALKKSNVIKSLK